MNNHIKSVKLKRSHIFAVLPNILGLIFLAIWRMNDSQFDLFSQILLISAFVFFISILLSAVRNKGGWPAKSYPKNTLLVSLVMAVIFYNLTAATLLNIDRSRSFYVLAWLDEDLLKVDDEGRLNIYATSKEAMNFDAISERLEEHRGRFFVTDDYKLSSLGKEAVRASNFLAKIFSLDGWFKNIK
jgi:hypothetical protein